MMGLKPRNGITGIGYDGHRRTQGRRFGDCQRIIPVVVVVGAFVNLLLRVAPSRFEYDRIAGVIGTPPDQVVAFGISQ